MFYSFALLLISIFGIVFVNHIPLLPNEWKNNMRVFLGLVVVILAVRVSWPLLNRPLRIGGALVLGASGVYIVDRVPIVSGVVPNKTKVWIKVCIGAIAAYLVIVNSTNIMGNGDSSIIHE